MSGGVLDDLITAFEPSRIILNLRQLVIEVIIITGVGISGQRTRAIVVVRFGGRGRLISFA